MSLLLNTSNVNSPKHHSLAIGHQNILIQQLLPVSRNVFSRNSSINANHVSRPLSESADKGLIQNDPTVSSGSTDLSQLFSFSCQQMERETKVIFLPPQSQEEEVEQNTVHPVTQQHYEWRVHFLQFNETCIVLISNVLISLQVGSYMAQRSPDRSFTFLLDRFGPDF